MGWQERAVGSVTVAQLPLPRNGTLRGVAEQLEAWRYVAEVWDESWRLAYLTEDYVLSAGAGSWLSEIGLGELVFSERTLALRDAWPAGATTASFVDGLVELAPAIAYDLPGGIDQVRAEAAPALSARLTQTEPREPLPVQFVRSDVKFGTTTRPFLGAVVRLYGSDGRFAGTASLITPALPGMVISLLGTGDQATLERLLGLLRPARRPGAVMFVDLEGSAQLARRLSTQSFFTLIRRLIFRIDEEVVSRRGVVGKHAGDGASAFFLSETFGGESSAARACIEAARAIRLHAAEIAIRSGLEAAELTVRFGLHWGSTIYVGRLLTGGRTEVTALGDEVNETARIESCASGGLMLASKPLLEQLSGSDAETLGLAPEELRYTPLTALPDVSPKAARDAPLIAVCKL
jgi:class 3 adenylate cyclase